MNSVEPPISVLRCPLGTQSLNLAERGQKELLILCNLNLHYGRLSLKLWKDILFAAEGQLDHQPMLHSQKGLPISTNSYDSDLRPMSRHEAYFGWRPDASAWIARPG